MISEKGMPRRNFLRAAVVAAGAAAAPQVSGAEKGTPLRIGMCDWNLGKTADVQAISVAREIGLNGVEVSLVSGKDRRYLRTPEVQDAYRVAALAYGIQIPSIAIGELNSVPLKSEPKTALWVYDAIHAARNIGAKNILLAFFGKGEIKMEDTLDVDRIVDVLIDLAPEAQKSGIILGLENTLSAENNMRILERVNSPAVQVYYDAKNSANGGFDVPREIRMLGKHICQAHLKNGKYYLDYVENLDFKKVAEAYKEIGYGGWYVLETSSPKDLIGDTRTNIELVKRNFGGGGDGPESPGFS